MISRANVTVLSNVKVEEMRLCDHRKYAGRFRGVGKEKAIMPHPPEG
jgi:hypothetical protein